MGATVIYSITKYCDCKKNIVVHCYSTDAQTTFFFLGYGIKSNIMLRAGFILLILLTGCVGSNLDDNMTVIKPKNRELYSVATIQNITDNNDPVHIYIEGDGRSFNVRGRTTSDPTPRSRFMRRMYAADKSPNIAYIARPCQFVMDKKCTETDWSTGRFSETMADSVAYAIKEIAGTRPVVLIGFSGGAMISGLIIQNHHDINVKQWVTIAGVLNHEDWTKYFGDAPLTQSLNMNTLPRVSQLHYVAQNDKTVPYSLSKKWVGKNKMVTIPDADHDTIPIIKIEFKD